MFLRIKPQPPLQFRHSLGGQRKSNSERMTAKTREKIRAAFKRIQQLKSIHGSSRAVCHTVFHADHKRRLGGALHHARSQYPNYSSMPAFAIHHKQTVSAEFGIACQALLNHAQRRCLRVTPFAIQPLQLRSQFSGPV